MRKESARLEMAPTTEPSHRPLSLPAGLFALMLSALWSGNPIAIKAALDDAPPLRLGWMRFAVGAVVVLAWAVATRADLRIRRTEWTPLLVLGVLFSVQIALMNVGLNHTTAGHGAVLTVTYPVWVAVLAHFFIPGDRLTGRKVMGVVIAYGGILVLFGDGLGLDGDLLLGDVLSATSGFLLGARQVYNARIVQDIHPAKLLLAQALFGIGAFVVASAIFEPDEYLWTGTLAVSILYQGAIIAGFGFIGNLWLIQHYLPSQVSVVALSQPILSILAAAVILGEDLSSALWLSALLVAIGAGLAQELHVRPRTQRADVESGGQRGGSRRP